MKNIKLLLTFIIVLFCNVAFSQNRANQPQHKIIHNMVDKFQTQSIQAYWTDERLKNAIPFPTPRISDQDLKILLKQAIEPTKDAPFSNIVLQPHSIPVRVDVNSHPYQESGKLFFTQNNIDYHCSAQFMGNKTTIITAAHCAKERNGAWSENVVFHRAYADGGGQLSSIVCQYIYNNWDNEFEGQQQKWDYAILKTRNPSTAFYLGLALHVPYNNFIAIGYARNYEGGRYMYRVSGSKGRIAGGIVQMRGNSLREGSSGGAWLINSNIIGLNAGYHQGNNTDNLGPYFDESVLTLYHHANSACN